MGGIFFAYGPLGAICWWLTRLVEKMRREGSAASVSQRTELAERDKLLRDVTAAHTKSMSDATHKIASLSLALTLNAATHGTGEIQRIAQREVERMERQRVAPAV